MNHHERKCGIIGTAYDAVGAKFLQLMVEAGKQQELEDYELFKIAVKNNAVMLHPWNGWFTLMANDFQSGERPTQKGDRARLTPLNSILGHPAQIGEIVAIVSNAYSRDLTYWRVTGFKKNALGFASPYRTMELERVL